MSNRRARWLGRAAATALVGSVVGTLVVVVGVVTPWQEVSPRWMGLVGAARPASTGLALVGAVAAVIWWFRPLEQRWRVLSAIAVVPCLVAVVLVAPILRGMIAPERPEAGTELVVAVQNTWHQHTDPERAAVDLLAVEADVLVLIELTARQLEAIDAEGGGSRYPYRSVRPADKGDGVGVLSNRPLELLGDPGLSAVGLLVEVQVGSEPVTLIAVHPRAPKDRWGLERWRTDLATLTDLSRSVDGPLVVAADLNATEGHRAFRRLLSEAGLRDAHDVSGSGFTATWPGRWIPAFMRLDRILVSEGLGVRSAGRLPPIGSDQFGVEARITVPQS